MAVDFTKPLQTRAGLPVRIYSRDGGGIQPVHGAIFMNGSWKVWTWTEGGSAISPGCEQTSDLVNVPALDMSQSVLITMCDVYGNEPLPGIPSGYRIKIENGKPAFRIPVKGEWYLAVGTYPSVQMVASKCCAPRLIMERVYSGR